MLTPRTPHAAAGSRGSATFTGRTGFSRRRASAVSAGLGHGGHHLRLALAALIVAVVCVIAWTVSARFLQPEPVSEGVQPALNSRIPRREVVDSGRSAAASDYEPQLSDSGEATAPPDVTARAADDASGVSLYTCGAGAPGFSWTLTPSGALRNGDGRDCLSFAEGDAALLLTLVPCDSPKVLPFTLHELSGQVRTTLPAGGPDGVFCLDTGDANTQGAPLLLQPCLEEEAASVRPACQACLLRSSLTRMIVLAGCVGGQPGVGSCTAAASCVHAVRAVRRCGQRALRGTRLLPVQCARVALGAAALAAGCGVVGLCTAGR